MRKVVDGTGPRETNGSPTVREFVSVFRHTPAALRLLWSTSRTISVLLAAESVLVGVLPAVIAYVGKLIVDAVVAAAAGGSGQRAVQLVGVELVLAVLLAGGHRAISICDSLLRAKMGQRVNEMILEKALTLRLSDFEDSEIYDRMTSARREASFRPLALVRRMFTALQNVLSLVGYGGLLVRFSPVTAVVLALASLPVFFAETAYSADAFRLFRFRAPEARMQTYLETLLAREDHAKEVTLFRLGPLFLGRYRKIFEELYGEDRALSLRRGIYGFLLGVLSTVAFYGVYAFIVYRAVTHTITLGDMTMYVVVFRQGQATLSAILGAVSGMYEDNLYLSNLHEFLAHPVSAEGGTESAGPDPADGLRFDHVSFTYPGRSAPALSDVSLHVPRGGKLALVGENGAGKTTLIKLLTRLYTPDSGTISLDGLPLERWEPNALRARIGVIFQDFIRYQLLVGENIGAGDVGAFDDETRWRTAAEKGMAAPFVEKLPSDYRTQLGKWFKGGQELSIGQWQKIALSRAFMREHADVLVLDEPTAAMDAEAEAEVFQRFRSLSKDRIGIVISHRFSTVRMADEIAVLEDGRVTELGTHDALMARRGRYARLFELQAEGYR
ncbi:MAG TPA: ABC transporter ATP-binding protein [Polyangiaceae bacterium]|nr:ABC transporter ATP-binding protein [Polyangiaceae bacterium]